MDIMEQLVEHLVSIAQLVERATVNRKATGSTPVRNVVVELKEIIDFLIVCIRGKFFQEWCGYMSN